MLEPSVFELFVLLEDFAGDHDGIDIARMCMEDDGFNRVIDREQVQVVAVEHRDVGLLAGFERADLFFHSHRAGGINRCPLKRLARLDRQDLRRCFGRPGDHLIIQHTLRLQRHAHDREHVARNIGFNIDPE